MGVLDESTISAEAHNAIPDVDEQQLETPADWMGALLALGAIFLQFGLHKHYGAGLLHRHIKVLENHIMVHRSRGGLDECTAMLAGQEAIVPHSFYLNNHDRLQAYEYEVESKQTAQRAPLSEAFAVCFREELHRRKLQSLVSIVPYDADSDSILVETLFSDGSGMITDAWVGGEDPHASEGLEDLITTWAFKSTNSGEITVVMAKRCRKFTNGMHVRSYG